MTMDHFKIWDDNIQQLVKGGIIKVKKYAEGNNAIKVFGPPGTGKTTLAINMIKWFIEDGMLLNDITYCSFTKSANVESLNKLKENGFNVENAANFATLHSLGFKLGGFRNTDLLKRTDFIEFCKSVGLSYGNNQHTTIYNFEDIFDRDASVPPASAFQGLMTYQMNTWVQDDELYKRNKDMFSFGNLDGYINLRNKYKEFKKDSYKYDYNDMLVSAYYNTPPKGEVLFVDEAQDLSPFQWKIIDKWREHYKLVVILGDDDQAIYRFLGGSASLFNGFAATEIVLTYSHRMPVSVFNISSKVLQRIHNRADKEFNPNERLGSIQVSDYRDIKFDELEGNTFCLFRNKIYMQEAINYFVENGVNFGFIRGKHSSDLLRLASLVTDIQNNNALQLSDVYYCKDYYPKEMVTNDFRNTIKKYRYSKDAISLAKLSELGMSVFIDGMKQRKYEVFKSFNLDNKIEFNYFIKLLTKFSYNDIIKPKVMVGTMHSSKGLEADNVYLNDMATRRTYENAYSVEQREDEARLMYVAMTRTKNNLFTQRHDISKNYMVY